MPILGWGLVIVVMVLAGCGGSPLAPTPAKTAQDARCEEITPLRPSPSTGEPRALLNPTCGQ